MTQQLSLYEAQQINAPYQAASETSIEAAVAAGPSVEPQKTRILRYLARHGGRTQAELEAEMYFARQTISARVNALEHDKLVAKTGERRDSKYGRACAEYVITPAGRERLKR